MPQKVLDNLLVQAQKSALAARWPEAVSILSQAFAISPSNFDVLTTLGVSHVAQNKLEASLTYFQQALTVAPHSTEAHTNLGVVYCFLRNQDAAVSAFSQAISLDPTCAPAGKLLAAIRASEASHEEAKRLLRTVLQSHPQDMEALLFLAKYYEFEEDFEAAQKTYQALLGWYADHSEARRALNRMALIKARKAAAKFTDPAKTVVMMVDDRSIDRRVLEEARSLANAGWQVTVLAGLPLQENPMVDEESYQEVNIVRMHDARYMTLKCLRGHKFIFNRILKSPIDINRLARCWNSALPNKTWHSRINDFFWEALERPAAVYTAHDMPQLPNATLAARYHGAYLAYDAHEFYPEQIVFSPENKKLFLEMDAALSPGADLVTIVNESLAREMHERYHVNPEVILNCPSGFSEPLPEPRPDIIRGNLGIPKPVKILLYQGAMVCKLRNLENVIRAMGLLNRADVAFVLMGPDPWNHKPELVQLARECGVLNTRVYFHDSVSQTELLKHTASADAGIIPYLPVDLNTQYCTPNKLFEFLAAELPILATNLPELTRFVSGQGAGLNRSLNTPEEIAKGIEDFFSSDLQAFRNNLHQISRRFVWQNHEGPKIVELYSRMIKAPPKAAPVANSSPAKIAPKPDPDRKISRKPTLLSRGHFDQSGIICFFTNEDQECYNPFEVAVQALIGEDVMLPYWGNFPCLKPRFYNIRYLPDPRENSYNLKALEWLCTHFETLPNGAAAWRYSFDLVFRDVVVLAPWSSAFGQAYVILALLLWYRHSRDAVQLRLALQAAAMFTSDISQGGLTHNINKDECFFEEVPSERSTHILNAHLITLVALLELQEYSKEPWVTELIRKGMNAARKHLCLYDTGNWSVYDLLYESSLFLRLSPTGDFDFGIKSLSLDTGQGDPIVLRPTEGADFQNTATRLAGIDWGAISEVEGARIRRIDYGPAKYANPVPGGTLQNSYAYFGYQLKDNFDTRDLTLTVDAFSKVDCKVKLELRDWNRPDLEFYVPDQSFVLHLTPGWNQKQVKIPRRYPGKELHISYHRFHVSLLEAIYRLTNDSEIQKVYARFNEYLRRQSMPESQPPLTELPRTVFFSVNTVCGLHCKMCDVGSKNTEAAIYKFLNPKPNALLSAATVKKIADELKGKADRFAFIGTEPMLHPDIEQILRISKEGGFAVQLTTNGINLEKKYKTIIDTGVKDLWLSIDGPAALHDDIRGRKGLFENILSGLKAMLAYAKETNQAAPDIFISYTISNLNYLALEEFIQAFSEIPFRNICFSHLNYVTPEIAVRHNTDYPDLPTGPSTTNPSINNAKMNFLALHSMCERVKIKYGNRVSFVPDLDFWELVDFYLHPETLVGNARCLVPWRTIQVLADGSCVPMSRCFMNYFGNVNEQSMKEIWHSQAMNRFRIKLWNQKHYQPCLRCCGML